MTGSIFALKRFAVHDGPGIRTTLFFKGCPLDCIWCHNPEGKGYKNQIALYQHKCAGCKACAAICKNGAHIFDESSHVIDRSRCIVCGECTSGCYFDALEFFGKSITVDEAYAMLTEDKDFYTESSGGITLSGGECLSQADFAAEILKKAKADGIHTAVDTCGFVSREAFLKVMPYTDVFLYDVKAFSEESHKRATGFSNKIILENLEFITKTHKVIVRFPYVPDYNGHEIEDIAKYLSGLDNIVKVDVLKYHNFSGSKYLSLDMENTMPDVLPPTDEMMQKARDVFRKYNLNADE